MNGDQHTAEDEDGYSRSLKRQRVYKTNICDLPNELLVEIFAECGALNVPTLQRVCRRFNNIVKDSTMVWRNAYELHKRATSFQVMCKRIQRIRLKSGQNNIHAVEINLNSIHMYDRLSWYQHMSDVFCLVGELDVFHLRIDWKYRHRYRYHYTEYQYMTVLQELYLRVLSRPSARLDSLYLRRAPDVHWEHFEIRFRHTAQTILSTLQCLRIEGGCVHTFLVPVDDCFVYSKLTYLHLDEIKCYEGAVGLYAILKAAKRTLEVLHLHLLEDFLPFQSNNGQGKENSSQMIEFSNLHTLSLEYEYTRSCSGPQVYHFSCPRLQHNLHLQCLGDRSIFDSLMVSTLKSMTIDYQMTAKEEHMQAFALCTDLTTITVKNLRPAGSTPRLARLININFDELRLTASEKFPSVAFESMIRSRLMASPPTTTLQKIVVYDASKFPQHKSVYDEIQTLLPQSSFL